MSSVVAPIFHASRKTHREKSGTKQSTHADLHDSGIILLSLDSSATYVWKKFFCRAVSVLCELEFSEKLTSYAMAATTWGRWVWLTGNSSCSVFQDDNVSLAWKRASTKALSLQSVYLRCLDTYGNT